MASKADKIRTPALATALAVLKGAISKSLGAGVTSSFTYNSKTKGRIAVEYTKEKDIEEAEIRKIEALANGKILEDVEVKVIKVNRDEAEATYKKELVNGMFIYDKMLPPADVKELNLVLIDGWVVNAVRETEYLKKAGEVNAIQILRTNFRPQKSELEFAFEVVPPEDERSGPLRGAAEASKPKKIEAPSIAGASKKASLTKSVESYVDDLLAVVVSQALKSGLPEEKKAELVKSLRADTISVLNSLKNQSYASGFKAKGNN
jgi:alanyl-tRNA synthetase